MQPRVDPESLFARLQEPLPAGLVPICAEIRKLLSSGVAVQAKGRYLAGVLVRKVQADSRYGAVGVTRLANTLQIDESTLKEYAVVATLWMQEQFFQWMSRRNKAGLPLTFGHFRVLARGMRIAQRREQMLQVALENCLSAADLQREIEHELRIVGAARRDPLVAGTGRMVARANSLAESAKQWKATLVPRLMRADPHKTVQLVREARAAMEMLRDEADAVLELLEGRGARRSSRAAR